MMDVKVGHIFIRGLTRGTIHWGSFLNLAEETFGKENCEFLEIPGNGELSHMLTPVDPEKVVEYLRRNSRLLASGKKIHLCGISLGSMIALKWLELFPSEIHHVTIINSSLNSLSSFQERLLTSNYLTLIKLFFKNDCTEREEGILRITSNVPANVDHYKKIFGAYALKKPLKKINFFLQLILAMKIQIKSLEQDKVTVLVSLKDRLVSYQCSEAIANKFQAEMFYHQTAGHDLPLDDPHWLLARLIETKK